MGNINIEISEELHKKAKVHCAMNSINLKDYIIRLLEKKVEEEEKKK